MPIVEHWYILFPMSLVIASSMCRPNSVSSFRLFCNFLHVFLLPFLLRICQARTHQVNQSLTLSAQNAIASRAVAPDITTCGMANFPDGVEPNDCCPKVSNIIDFKLPPTPEKLRVRRPAHLATPEYIANYTKAVAAMKALPKDDPRSYIRQANIHCAYCAGSFHQEGFPNMVYNVHFSWLFFPFHRMYIFFYERMLGKLIGDPNFALPFWNYDHPDGMTIPSYYDDPESPLYDEKRDQNHRPPSVVDFSFIGTEHNLMDERTIEMNLYYMHRNVVTQGKSTEMFLGSPYRAGGEPSRAGRGTLELSPHSTMHLWLGDPREIGGQNMGLLSSSGRDPIFYIHHSSLDRIWTIWRTLDGGSRENYDDIDWLDSALYFYDENAQLLRVKVRDFLDEKALGYTYEEVEMPWMQYKPTPRKPKHAHIAQLLSRKLVPTNSKLFPSILEKPLSVLVPRPKKLRSKWEKEQQEEILVIEDIEFELNTPLKFDVHVNDDEEDLSGPENTEYVGSFFNMRQNLDQGVKNTKTSFKIAITEVLEDLNVEADDSILVTLVPKLGHGKITIGGVKIEFLSSYTTSAKSF